MVLNIGLRVLVIVKMTKNIRKFRKKAGVNVFALSDLPILSDIVEHLRFIMASVAKITSFKFQLFEHFCVTSIRIPRQKVTRG